MGEIVFQRVGKPWYYPDFVFRLSSLGREQQKCLSVLHGRTQSVIRTRKQEFLKDLKQQARDGVAEELGKDV
jgi:hypothetical protein